MGGLRSFERSSRSPLEDRLRDVDEVAGIEANIGDFSHENILIRHGHGLRLGVVFSDDDDGVARGSRCWTARLCDDIGEHEAGSEFDDAWFLDLPIDGDGSFRDFFIDADDGGIAQVGVFEHLREHAFEFVASHAVDVDFTERWDGNRAAWRDLVCAAEFFLSEDAQFESVPGHEFSELGARGASRAELCLPICRYRRGTSWQR